MTTYQAMVKSHLVSLFQKAEFITSSVLIEETEKDFVTDLCIEWGFTPCFGVVENKYTTFIGIKKIRSN